MYDLLVRLMVVSALLQLGMSVSHLSGCHGRSCAQQIEARSRDVLHVDWRAVSMFPEEARRLR